jgi:molecular chaperone GrpE
LWTVHAQADDAEENIEVQDGESSQQETEDKDSSSAAEDTPQAPTYVRLLERVRDVAVDEDVLTNELDATLSDLESEFAGYAQQTAALGTQLASKETAVKSAKEQWIRLNADFDNFRKRSANEKAAALDAAKADVIKQLLPLVDNFELAKGQVKPTNEGEQKIADSYQGLYKQMVEIFRALGVDAVPGVGSPFDPEFHDAIMRQPNNEVPDGTVLQEFRKGFKVGDKLLRAAMVQVSYTDETAEDSSSSSNGNGAAAGQAVSEDSNVAEESNT